MARDSALAALARQDGAKPWVLGHRGARRAAPENTLSAFELALAEGAAGVELDVRLDGSGRVVVLHDRGLERVTGGAHAGLVHELSPEDLARIELVGGERVPALADVLTWAVERDARVNVELKGDAPDLRALAAGVITLVKKLGAPPELVWFSSFHPWLVRTLGHSLPDHASCWLLHQKQRAFRDGSLYRVLGASGVHPEHVLIDQARMRVWRRQGALVATWTVNTADDARRVSELGVDVIISDHPALILAAL